MTDLPERFLPEQEWSPADFARHARDESWRPESPEYVAARDKALARAGFEPETKPLDFDSMSQEELAELSPAQHHERITRPR